jgi:UDP-GlcNAc:undecaprenyl-phosphate GlcNAc-1-phosphate transferase
MFVPDRSHIHHRLIARGMSHKAAVLLLYVVSCLLGAVAFAITFTNGAGGSYVLLAVGIAVIIGIRQLRYTEMAVLRNGMLLPFYEGEFLNRDTVRGFLDLGFIIAAFWGANLLTDGRGFGAPFSGGSIETIALASAVQFAVLLMTGLYRETARHISLRDTLRITRSVTLAVPAGYVAMRMLHVTAMVPSPASVILNFYFLLSAILVTRASFNILMHLSMPNPDGRPRVLLYGAGPNGLMVLERVLQGDLQNLTPVGFIDEDPLLEGKSVRGYPVYGGHWKIERVLRKFNVDEIVFVEDHVLPEIQRRIQKLATAYGIALRRIRLSLETVTLQPAPLVVEEIVKD